jgi:hypothetical protein
MMKHKTIPESELVCSFLGYAVAGFFLIHTPIWGLAFAVAFVLAEAVGSWARLVPLRWIGGLVVLVPIAWFGIVTLAGAAEVFMAEAIGAMIGAGVAGAVAWFVLWAVSRRLVLVVSRMRLAHIIQVGIFAMTGAVTWFVFGSVAGRVALAISKDEFANVAIVVAWAWAWAWAWFLFEKLAGVVAGGIGWAVAGLVLGFVFGVPVWTWAVAGAGAGLVVVVLSTARRELLNSFTKLQTFGIMAGTSLLGLGVGRLASAVFLP